MRHILLRSLLDIFVIILLGHRDYTFFYIERGGGIHPTFFGIFDFELVVESITAERYFIGDSDSIYRAQTAMLTISVQTLNSLICYIFALIHSQQKNCIAK